MRRFQSLHTARLLLFIALVAAVAVQTAVVVSAAVPEWKKKQFQQLTQVAKDHITVLNFAAARDALEEALALKPSSTRTANDLGVALLQWASDDIAAGMRAEVGGGVSRWGICSHHKRTACPDSADVPSAHSNRSNRAT